MIKRFLSGCMVFLCVFSLTAAVSAAPVSAKEALAEASDGEIILSETVEYLEDGSYIVTTLSEPEIQPMSDTITKIKKTTKYTSDNVPIYNLRLVASFNYDGKTSTCIVAAEMPYIFNKSWQITDRGAQKSGNKATGYVKVRFYDNGVATSHTDSITVTMTCTPAGVVY